MNKWANGLNRQFSKEVQMAHKHMKNCSTFLAIKEMQIKMTLRFHLTLVRMIIINTQTTTNASEDVGRKRNPYPELVVM
jgi:hypothetical protein